MELDVGGIPVAHCVGDALYGDLGKAICDLRILRQYSLKLHRNIHALKGFPQQLQAVGWAQRLILLKRCGQAAHKLYEQRLIQLLAVPQGAQQQADPLPQEVVYPALAPGDFLRLADGL